MRAASITPAYAGVGGLIGASRGCGEVGEGMIIKRTRSYTGFARNCTEKGNVAFRVKRLMERLILLHVANRAAKPRLPENLRDPTMEIEAVANQGPGKSAFPAIAVRPGAAAGWLRGYNAEANV